MKILSMIGLIFLSFWTYGQNSPSAHQCKFPIEPMEVRVNGTAKGIQPGDTLCLTAGRRPFVHFSDLKGSKEKPILIRNCGGKVVMGGPAVKDAIMLLRSKHVRISGSGDPASPYGIHIVETRKGSQGVQITLFSSDIEVDHLEIEKAGFAGIMAKTDPLCDGSADRGAFTMENIYLHDNYIHDVIGEGIYLGNSFYTGTEVYCNTLHYPHEVKHVRVYNNRVENAGWEAIQIGSAVEDCEIYNNVIHRYGQADKSMQNNGIQLGLGTTGRLYNNYIKEGEGAGIVIQGIGDNYVYNNLIISPGAEAFNINTREPLADKGVYILNNTVIDAEVVLREHINEANNNVFINNLIVGAGSAWNQLKPYTDWRLDGNLFLSHAEAQFVDPDKHDYRLKDAAKAQAKGTPIDRYAVTHDFCGAKRHGSLPDVGAFQHE